MKWLSVFSGTVLKIFLNFIAVVFRAFEVISLFESKQRKTSAIFMDYNFLIIKLYHEVP